MPHPVSQVPRVDRRVGPYAVQISESPGKPLMLLVRMAARGMGVWDGVWDPLTELFTVAQFDLPAPDLDRITEPAEIFRNYARICVEVAEALGHRRFHMLGWTGGTHVAIHALINWPERIASCVLLGPVGALPDSRVVEHGLAVQRMLLDKGLVDYTWSWILSGMSWDHVLEHYDQVEEIVTRRMEADRGRLDTERVFKWIRALRYPSYTEAELERITTPVLIAVQGFDRWPSLAMARRLHGQIPDAELAVIHGGGALVLIEAPDKFMSVAGRFLRAAARADLPARRLRRADAVDLLAAGRRTGVVEPAASSAVVFLHGWLMSPAMWSEACAALAGRARCVALWQPAHGPSSAPPHGFTMEQWADWVRDNLAALGIERAVLVGHSMGGLLAQATARRHPGLVSGLVLVGIQDTPWPERRNGDFAVRVDAVAAQWDGATARALGERLLGNRLLERDPGLLGRWESAVRGYDLAGMANLAHAITTRPDFSQDAPAVPTLVVHGDADGAIAYADGRAMARRIPGARMERFAGAGHCVPQDVPAGFARVLRSFLRRHKLPG